MRHIVSNRRTTDNAGRGCGDSPLGKSSCAHCSDAMLASPGLGHDLLLPHLAAQQRLAQSVVDLVRACVVEVLPLEVDTRLPAVRPAPTIACA